MKLSQRSRVAQPNACLNTAPVRLTAEAVGEYLVEGSWQEFFSAEAQTQGQRLARSRKVDQLTASALDTGDFEVTATVHDPALPGPLEAVLAFWLEKDSLHIDTSCSCPVRQQCRHAVAVLTYLAKGKPGQRLAAALGDRPHADRMTTGQHLKLENPPSNSEGTESADGCPPPVFRFRVERRRGGPALVARATALYGDQEVPLEPSGMLRPIVTPSRKIKRDRVVEMRQIQALYALDLLPSDAEAPPEAAATHGARSRTWHPDQRAWPHPEYYWQRFRHEAVPALEKRGWRVEFASDTVAKPLVFRTETWRAEIVDEGRGWFTLSAGFEIDGESFDLQPILATLVANRFLESTADMPAGQEFLVFLPDGRGLALPIGRFRSILQTLGELIAFKFTSGPIRLTKVDAARLSEDPELTPDRPPDLEDFVVQLQQPHSFEPIDEPSGLRAQLRNYQQDGFCWMQFLARHGLHGILADDMGLGKTLQTLAHLLAELEHGRPSNKPSLVVAPTSVVLNWQREAEKFAPSLNVLVLQGPERKERFSSIAQFDLVLTSYALLHRDLDRYLEQTFHLLVLDEAQHIKNPGTKISRAVCQLNASHRLCLSGTPMENNLGEVWSLMHFLMPGWLGTLDEFNEQFRTPIETRGHEGKRQLLRDRLGPVILRRTKADVAKELPPKTEIPHTIELTPEQKDLYETVRSAMDKQVREALELQGQQSQIAFLDALLKLRQICCHPALLGNQSQEAETRSAKFDYLVELLETLRRENHRVLLFSQFTSMLALIETHLDDVECSYLKLTGGTKDRQDLVDRFQSGEGEVFLISLKAGGTGLTLTGADAIIHYDPWWNPAVENQATDRAYRIGQEKPVFVHKLICRDTVEERIQQMQTRKHHLASDLLAGATQSLSLNTETLSQLLAPSTPGEPT